MGTSNSTSPHFYLLNYYVTLNLATEPSSYRSASLMESQRQRLKKKVMIEVVCKRVSTLPEMCHLFTPKVAKIPNFGIFATLRVKGSHVTVTLLSQ